MTVKSADIKLIEVYDLYREDPAFAHLREQPGVRLVPGRGVTEPKLFIVGDAPGATENDQGKVFVGQSGRVLLSLMHDCAKIPSTAWFLTNVVKYRTPGNRIPEMKEIVNSRPYLRKEYRALGSPPVVIAVGNIAFGALRPGSAVVSDFAGKKMDMIGGAALFPMFHPSFGLRQSEMRETLERHWTQLGVWLRKEKIL